VLKELVGHCQQLHQAVDSRVVSGKALTKGGLKGGLFVPLTKGGLFVPTKGGLLVPRPWNRLAMVVRPSLASVCQAALRSCGRYIRRSFPQPAYRSTAIVLPALHEVQYRPKHSTNAGAMLLAIGPVLVVIGGLIADVSGTRANRHNKMWKWKESAPL
jgi:hypothetical protein